MSDRYKRERHEVKAVGFDFWNTVAVRIDPKTEQRYRLIDTISSELGIQVPRHKLVDAYTSAACLQPYDNENNLLAGRLLVAWQDVIDREHDKRGTPHVHLVADNVYQENLGIVLRNLEEASSNARFIPGMEDLIRNIARSEQHTLFLLTNSCKLEFEGAKKALGLDNLFYRVFTSYELEAAKPDEDAYQAVCDELSISPEEMVFIDDSELYIGAARNVGMQGIDFCFDEAHPEEDIDLLKTELERAGVKRQIF